MFLKDITPVQQRLYELLEMDKSCNWTEKHETVFTEIMKFWTTELSLLMPDYKARFVLKSDASDVGPGAVLRQTHGPMASILRALKGAEKNYGITEKELLAAMWAMEKLEHYLLGSHFTLITYHQAIKYIQSKKEFGNSRIKRWFEKIQRFQFDVKYREGVLNG